MEKIESEQVHILCVVHNEEQILYDDAAAAAPGILVDILELTSILA